MNRILCQRFHGFHECFYSFSASWQGNLSIVRNEEEAPGETEKKRVNSVGDWKQFEMDNNVKERTVGASIFCPWLEDLHPLYGSAMLEIQVSLRSGLAFLFRAHKINECNRNLFKCISISTFLQMELKSAEQREKEGNEEGQQQRCWNDI